MSNTSSSWRETKLIRRPSTAVPGECAPRSQKMVWAWHLRHDVRIIEDVGPGIVWWKCGVGRQQCTGMRVLKKKKKLSEPELQWREVTTCVYLTSRRAASKHIVYQSFNTLPTTHQSAHKSLAACGNERWQHKLSFIDRWSAWHMHSDVLKIAVLPPDFCKEIGERRSKWLKAMEKKHTGKLTQAFQKIKLLTYSDLTSA